MERKELIEKLKSLDIESMCNETSKDKTFETIRDLCGVSATMGGLAYLFADYCEPARILRVVQNEINFCLKYNCPEDALWRIYPLVADFYEYGDTEHYFYLDDDCTIVRRITVDDLVILRDCIVEDLEKLEKEAKTND